MSLLTHLIARIRRFSIRRYEPVHTFELCDSCTDVLIEGERHDCIERDFRYSFQDSIEFKGGSPA